MTKSAHKRFVHSCSQLALFFGGYTLDSRCDLRCIIELGEFVLPWSIFVHVPLDSLHQVTEAFSCVVPCALVMHITERSLNGIGPWTIRWQPQQFKAWVTGQPLLDGFGFMNTVVIDDDIDARHCGCSIRGVQQSLEVPKQPIVFSRTKTIQHFAGR